MEGSWATVGYGTLGWRVRLLLPRGDCRGESCEEGHFAGLFSCFTG